MKPLQPHYRSRSEDTFNCDEIIHIPLSFDDGTANFWSIHDKIDMSCYSFDLNESFSNIDAKLLTDETTKDCLKIIQAPKSNNENILPTNGDVNDVDEIIKALYQDGNN